MFDLCAVVPAADCSVDNDLCRKAAMARRLSGIRTVKQC